MRHPDRFRVHRERVLHRLRGCGLLARRPALRTPAGLVIAIGNVVYTVATIALVLADVFPLTTIGVVLTLATGVYTLVMAELQYQGVRRINFFRASRRKIPRHARAIRTVIATSGQSLRSAWAVGFVCRSR